jgi:hypothetical protein
MALAHLVRGIEIILTVAAERTEDIAVSEGAVA